MSAEYFEAKHARAEYYPEDGTLVLYAGTDRDVKIEGSPAEIVEFATRVFQAIALPDVG